MPATETTIESLKGAFPNLEFSEFRGQTRVRVPQESQFALMEYLCRTLGFDFLVDVTCVDMLNLRDAVDRFQLTYQLTSMSANERLTVLVMLNEPNLAVRSVYSLWHSADWMERETYDMFGVTFEGHPDLRRILMPEEFAAYPLRKDYPLQGRGERHNFPVIRRNEA